MAKRIFILGAGFSKMCGIPLSSEMVREIIEFSSGQWRRDWITRVENFTRSNFLGTLAIGSNTSLYPSITDYFNFVLQADTFERIFSLYPKGGKYWERFGSPMLRLMAEYLLLKVAHLDESSLNPVLNFINQLDENDVIISFNWDLLIEFAIKKARFPSEPLYMNQDEFGLLKLNGSIDWIRAPDPNIVPPHQISDLGSGLVRARLYDAPEVTIWKSPWEIYDRDPILVIPPTSVSSLENDYIKNLWRRAFVEMKDTDAEKIVFAGYRMDESEYFIRMMLQANYYNYHRKYLRWNGTHTRVEIYNPNSSVEKNYRLLFGNFEEIEFHDIGFEHSPYCQI